MSTNSSPKAQITIAGNFGPASTYDAPVNLLDITVPDLMEAGMNRTIAFAVASVALKLYSSGRADLGYGLTATVTGQLGDEGRPQP